MNRTWLVWLCVSLMSAAFLLTGCGTDPEGEGSGREYVYLHVFNGYPGATSLTLYGPSGRIVNGLPYGSRTNAPVRVDRNQGSEFLFVLDGAPETFDADGSLFGMYPAETGTLFVSRRIDDSVDFQIFRHIPSISPNCRLVLGNAIPSNVQNLADHSVMYAWNFAYPGYDIAQAGYVSPDPREDDDPQFLQRIRDYPYFFFAQLEDDELGFVWTGPEELMDIPRVDFASGRVRTPPPTYIVVECLAELSEPVMPTDPGGGATPEERLAYEDAFNDYLSEQLQYELDVAECKEPQDFDAYSVSPALSEYQVFHTPPFGHGPTDSCNAEIRVFSDFSNVFDGQHANGTFRDFEVQYGAAEHLFTVLYGFPVNPRVAIWRTGGEGGEFSGNLGSFDP